MLGTELRKAREAAGLTQEQLGAKAGITREYVSHLERGVYSPTVDVLMRVCGSMNLKAWQLLQRVENPAQM